MNRKALPLFFLLCLVTSVAHARGSNGKNNKFFFQGMIGTSILAEQKDTPNNIDDKQEAETGTGITAILGYRWQRFSLEFMAVSLGTPSHEVGQTYTEEHKPLFMGGGLHWTWNWFDLKLGWGNMSDKITYTQLASDTGTFSATPNDKSTSNTAGYFGIGLNFDLGQDTEFVIDYTGFGWTNDEAQTYNVDGVTSTFSETTNGIGIISAGLRWFI